MTSTLESQPKSNQAALSTPKEIDLVSLASEVAQRKSKDGLSFNGKKGKQSLFTGVCSAFRSLMGRSKLDDAGRVIPLPQDEVIAIEKAIATMWERKAVSLVNYGEVISYRKDVSASKIGKNGEAQLYLTATMKAKRYCADLSEWHRVAKLQLDKAKKRMDYMLDNAGKFDRDAFTSQKLAIEALEKALASQEMPKTE